MQKANTSDAKFWAGGANDFHNPAKKGKIKIGFFAYFFRLFPFFNPNEIDQRLFIKNQNQIKKRIAWVESLRISGNKKRLLRICG